MELSAEQFDALEAMIKAEVRLAYKASLVDRHPNLRKIRERFESAKTERDAVVDRARLLLRGLT